MIFRNAVVNTLFVLFSSSLSFLPMKAADAAGLDYNYEDFSAWNDFPGSFCDGQRNSPVAIKTKECTRYEDYAFTVSSCHH